MVKFFQKEGEERIIAAIKEAEKVTSGEIRVHVQKRCKGNILDDAARTFHNLKMDKTKQRNGVLIFIVPRRHEFAIIGDQGINDKVSGGYWNDVRDAMQKHFREGQFADGVVAGVKLVGEKLKEFFPWQSDDKNELSDDISYA